jgi:hypothetical protein
MADDETPTEEEEPEIAEGTSYFGLLGGLLDALMVQRAMGHPPDEPQDIKDT